MADGIIETGENDGVCLVRFCEDFKIIGTAYYFNIYV